MSLKVNLRFIGVLALKTGSNRIELELPASTTLADALEQIFKTYKLVNVEIGEDGVDPGYIRVFLNGRIVPINKVLKEDDEISFLPPLAGGGKTENNKNSLFSIANKGITGN